MEMSLGERNAGKHEQKHGLFKLLTHYQWENRQNTEQFLKVAGLPVNSEPISEPIRSLAVFTMNIFLFQFIICLSCPYGNVSRASCCLVTSGLISIFFF